MSCFALRAARLCSEGRELTGRTVLVEDGVVQDVVRRWPAGARRVDVGDAHWFPGWSTCIRTAWRSRPGH